MDYVILKHIPLTIDELKSDLFYSYNVIVIFSILFAICLLSFIIRELIFFKNKKKLDLDKRDFNLFNFLQSVVMGVSFVAVLFSIFSYSNKSETLNTITRKELEEKNVFKSLKSYWKSDISKSLKEGKNILIVTDEDTIRILIKYLLDMSDRDIQNVYIPIDNTFYFEVDKNLEVIRAEFPIPPKFPERIDEF